MFVRIEYLFYLLLVVSESIVKIYLPTLKFAGQIIRQTATKINFISAFVINLQFLNRLILP